MFVSHIAVNQFPLGFGGYIWTNDHESLRSFRKMITFIQATFGPFIGSLLDTEHTLIKFGDHSIENIYHIIKGIKYHLIFSKIISLTF